MLEIFRTLADLKQFKIHRDDDSADRLNRQYSSLMFVVMATIVSARQYLGQAIHCWCPEMCASNHETYANIMCWVDDTYYVPFLDRMPQGDEGRDRKITYYQWVPIILLLQAIMFVCPRILWNVLSGRCGINIGSVVESAESAHTSTSAEAREKNLRFVVHLMDRYLLARQYKSQLGCCFGLARGRISRCDCFSGSYLSICYLFVKVVYLTNAVGQIFLLNVFLGYEFHAFGVQVVTHLLGGGHWSGSERFPHVTMCDFRIRQNTNVHRYTVQCVLPINIFNEKVFVIVWFWLVIVALVTLVSMLQWFTALVCIPNQVGVVKNQITATLGEMDRLEMTSLRIFARRHLRRDGLFVLRLMEKNAGYLVTAEVVCGLWLNYRPKFRNQAEKDHERTVTIRRTPKRDRKAQFSNDLNLTPIEEV